MKLKGLSLFFLAVLLVLVPVSGAQASADKVKPQITGASVSPALSKGQTQIAVKFRLSERARVWLKVTKDGKRYLTIYNGKLMKAGNAAWFWPGQKAEGQYAISLYARDLAGNISTPLILRTGVDRIQPVLRPEGNVPQFVNPLINRVRFDYILSEDALVSIRIAGVGDSRFRTVKSLGQLKGKNHFYWDGRTEGIPLADGRYTLEFTCLDRAGNISLPWKKDITIDTQGPIVTGASFLTNEFDPAKEQAAFTYFADEDVIGTLDIKDEQGNQLWSVQSFVYAPGGIFRWNGQSSAGTQLAVGEYTYQALFSDRAGNQRTYNGLIKITNDDSRIPGSQTQQPITGVVTTPIVVINPTEGFREDLLREAGTVDLRTSARLQEDFVKDGGKTNEASFLAVSAAARTLGEKASAATGLALRGNEADIGKASQAIKVAQADLDGKTMLLMRTWTEYKQAYSDLSQSLEEAQEVGGNGGKAVRDYLAQGGDPKSAIYNQALDYQEEFNLAQAKGQVLLEHGLSSQLQQVTEDVERAVENLQAGIARLYLELTINGSQEVFGGGQEILNEYATSVQPGDQLLNMGLQYLQNLRYITELGKGLPVTTSATQITFLNQELKNQLEGYNSLELRLGICIERGIAQGDLDWAESVRNEFLVSGGSSESKQLRELIAKEQELKDTLVLSEISANSNNIPGIEDYLEKLHLLEEEVVEITQLLSKQTGLSEAIKDIADNLKAALSAGDLYLAAGGNTTDNLMVSLGQDTTKTEEILTVDRALLTNGTAAEIDQAQSKLEVAGASLGLLEARLGLGTSLKEGDRLAVYAKEMRLDYLSLGGTATSGPSQEFAKAIANLDEILLQGTNLSPQEGISSCQAITEEINKREINLFNNLSWVEGEISRLQSNDISF